jgi:hypothetical protein
MRNKSTNINSQFPFRDAESDIGHHLQLFIQEQINFSARLILFLQHFVSEIVTHVIGPPPENCPPFALFVVGSLSRCDALAYSDVEYGFVFGTISSQANQSTVEAYFSALLLLLHVQVKLV